MLSTSLLPAIGAVLGASLLGSLHCAGMCGGLVACAVGFDEGDRASRLGAQTAYHGARLIGYAALGALAGFLGSVLELGGSMVGVSRAAGIFAGAILVIAGVAMLLRAHGARIPKMPVPKTLERLFARGMRVANARGPLLRAFLIGAITPLLPCGWLWAFLATSAGTAHPLAGALVMVAFWLGTVPILAAIGGGVQHLAGPLRRHLPALTAVVLVAVGLLTIAGRVTRADEVAAAVETWKISNVQDGLDEVQRSIDELPACCRETSDAGEGGITTKGTKGDEGPRREEADEDQDLGEEGVARGGLDDERDAARTNDVARR